VPSSPSSFLGSRAFGSDPAEVARMGSAFSACSVPAPRLALTAMEAPEALGVSHDFFREHIATELRWVRRGRKKLVAVRELERWLEENAARVFGDGA
jgi:hypothetical protein